MTSWGRFAVAMLRQALFLTILTCFCAQAAEVVPQTGTDGQHHEWLRKFIPAPEPERVANTGSTGPPAACERRGRIFDRLPFGSWDLVAC